MRHDAKGFFSLRIEKQELFKIKIIFIILLTFSNGHGILDTMYMFLSLKTEDRAPTLSTNILILFITLASQILIVLLMISLPVSVK